MPKRCRCATRASHGNGTTKQSKSLIIYDLSYRAHLACQMKEKNIIIITIWIFHLA